MGVSVAKARDRLQAIRHLGGRTWGLDPYLFFQLVKGAILPLLFFGTPCWASVLGQSMQLAQLDSVLALVVRMAFYLEHTMSMDASLALAGIWPAQLQILQ